MSSSFDELLNESFPKWVNELKALSLFRSNSVNLEEEEDFINFDIKLKQLELAFEQLKTQANKELKYVNESKRITENIIQQRLRMSDITNNLPENLPRLPVAIKPVIQNLSIENKENDHTNLIKESNEISVEEKKKVEPKLPPSIQFINSVQHITEDTLSSVPAYLRGRATLEKVNESIDQIKKLLRNKYLLLNNKNTSKMSEKSMKLQKEFRRQIVVNKELKNAIFFFEADLKTFSTIKQDSTGKAIIQVLRHLQILKELQIENKKCYILN